MAPPVGQLMLGNRPNLHGPIPVAVDEYGRLVITTDSGLTVAISTITGAVTVVGNAASGVADSGNPIKVGAKYNAANISVTDGQRVDAQASVNGFLRTDMGTLLAGEDLTIDRIKTAPKYNYTAITTPPTPTSAITISTQTTTVVKSGAGILAAIIINKPLASGVIKIDDATSDTTPVIGTITLPATLLQDGPKVGIYNIAFNVGLTIVTSGATQDITVVWL